MKMKKIFKATLSIALSLALFMVMLSPVNAATPARTVEPVSVSKEAPVWWDNAFSETPADAQSVNTPIIVTTFTEKNFYSDTPLEARAIQSDVDLISFCGVCANGATDTVIFHIIDRSHGGLYDLDIPFEADGSYGSMTWTLPAGRYWLYFTAADSTVLKEEVVVVFAHS